MVSDNISFFLFIQTGDGFKGAGVDRTVKLEIVGENGDTTGFLTLDNFWRNDFEKGRRDIFSIQADDVGLPILVRISKTACGKISPITLHLI